MIIDDLTQYVKEYKYIPIICGPTASGKSSIALSLCEKIGGELVSCDSMQIYNHLDVGTAKATMEERSRVPHHMIDIVEPGLNYSVNDYLYGVKDVILDILSRGKLPVICGGTGQYVSALRDGIKYVDEPIPQDLVDALYKEAEEQGIDRIYSELSLVDPEAASGIHPNNTRRVIRAYAVYKATGKTFTEWNKESKKSGPMFPFMLFEPDYEDCRDVLYDRINKRVDIMMDEGLLDEVNYLYSLDTDRTSTCFQAIGYKEFKLYVENGTKEALDRAIYEVKLNSRHYAKRQLTWFRYIDGIIKLDPQASMSTNLDVILNKISS
ncbi:MAG: tRNA (adenosine(37)-N6)-dimethylallyltransferase MiaA [Saccharofermentans sp.]|nr:tRNA (adenosine(37)-N6)-dimethylallyltransferase MiaA [Saccharofermentans sp.]